MSLIWTTNGAKECDDGGLPDEALMQMQIDSQLKPSDDTGEDDDKGDDDIKGDSDEMTELLDNVSPELVDDFSTQETTPKRS